MALGVQLAIGEHVPLAEAAAVHPLRFWPHDAVIEKHSTGAKQLTNALKIKAKV